MSSELDMSKSTDAILNKWREFVDTCVEYGRLEPIQRINSNNYTMLTKFSVEQGSSQEEVHYANFGEDTINIVNGSIDTITIKFLTNRRIENE